MLLEVGNEVGVVGDDGERVTGRDERISAVNHVAITVTIRGGSERNVVLVDDLDEGVGVGQVGIRVATVEIRARLAVLSSTSKAKLLLKDGLAVRTSDAGQTVKEDLEVGVGRKELLDSVKVENVLEHGNIVGSAVNDLNLERSIDLCSDSRDVDVGDRSKLVGSQRLGGIVNLVRDRFGSGAAVGQVVLDAEVVLGTYTVF